jgi:putative transposase
MRQETAHSFDLLPAFCPCADRTGRQLGTARRAIRVVVGALYIDGISLREFARREGVAPQAISARINALARQFAAERLNQRWVGDTTEFVIGSSAKLYLAAILDLYSRFCVGWAVSAVNDRHLALRALDMSLKRRRPEAGLLHHSD